MTTTQLTATNQPFPSSDDIRAIGSTDSAKDSLNKHERTKSGSVKPPSLDQLVAKIKPDAAQGSDSSRAAGATGSSRLRLPPSALSRAGASGSGSATGSASASTETSPITASAPLPPLPDNAIPSGTTRATPAPALALHPPTEDNAESSDPSAPVQAAETDPQQLQQLPSQPRVPRGYKNVPSLEAISSRLAALRERSRTRSPPATSEDGALKDDADKPYATGQLRKALEDDASLDAGEDGEREEGEISEDPAYAEAGEGDAPTAANHAAHGGKADEHPLLHAWVWFYDNKSAARPSTGDILSPSTPTTAIPTPTTANSLHAAGPPHLDPSPVAREEYEAGLSVIGEFDTVEEFARYWNWCKPPSKLERGSNYHLFKKDIKPMWEDPANAKGGKWVLTMRNNPTFLDKCWNELLIALIGELSLDPLDEVTGCVVSLRSRIDRIQLWTRARDDVEKVNALGKRMAQLLGLEKEVGVMFEYQYHTDEWPHPGKYITVNTTVPHHGSAAASAAPGSSTSGGVPALQHGGGVMGSFGVGPSWRAGSTTAAASGGRPARSSVFGERRESKGE